MSGGEGEETQSEGGEGRGGVGWRGVERRRTAMWWRFERYAVKCK
jgi:hypothetical protein